MRMVLCWSDISGYITACWRALAAVPGVELQIIAFEPPQASFGNDLVRGLNCQLLTPKQRDDTEYVKSLIVQSRPDVLFVVGWLHPPYRKAVHASELDSISKWIGIDTPWKGTLRQQVGRFALRPFINRLDRVFVAGERAWQYAGRLGVPQNKICRGFYGIDYNAFSGLHERRQQQPGGWPRRFLYTGRYVPEKGLDVLTAAYAKYRESVTDPWPLGCCGGGPLKSALQGQTGIEDFGFQQPSQLPAVMERHGAFVLPSRYEPWGVVVAEASAGGLPVICSEACGAGVELVRSYFNGIPVATGDISSLSQAMVWMHKHHAELPQMGSRGRHLAEAYSAQMWAARWSEAARQCVGRAK